MNKLHLAAGLALAGLTAACSSDTLTSPSSSAQSLTPRFAGGISGAFNTTESSCTDTNINTYTSKQAVYLSGSPATANLPEGNYYVRVQTPNGVDLGTTATASYVVAEGSTACIQLWSLVEFANTTNPGGEYRVLIDMDGDFRNAKNDNFKILADEQIEISTIVSVTKFYDANANGIKDGAEVDLNGWKVSVAPFLDASYDVFTPYSAELANGFYTFTEYDPIQANWYATTPKVVERTIGTDSPDVVFGNVCVGAGGGSTLGFWSNKNGQALVGGDDLSILNALFLRNAAGADMSFANYASFRTWILGATATNMAYMLSAQLAAMQLNVYNGRVTGSALIYAPGTTAANAAGFATVNAVMAEAASSLESHAITLSGHAQRAHQEALKNALDAANNNTNFVQPTACPFSFETV